MKRIVTSQILALSIILQLVTSPAMAADRTRGIGVQAYIYAYPLVMMEITRRVSTNVEAAKGVIGKIIKIGKQPLNVSIQFFHNIETPRNGPNWSARFQLPFLFPK